MTQTMDRPRVIPLDQQPEMPDVNDGREPVNTEVRCAYGLAACAGDCEPCEVIPNLDPQHVAKKRERIDEIFGMQWHLGENDKCIWDSKGGFIFQPPAHTINAPHKQAFWERLIGEHNALVMARRG